MRNVLFFGIPGIFALYGSVTAQAVLPMIVLANMGIAFLAVGLAFGTKTPGIFMKTSNGRLSLLSYLIFWPYLVLNYLFLILYRRLSRENPMDEIIPGLYVGRQLLQADQEIFNQRDIRAVVDVTSEWSEAGFIRTQCAYLCVPILDTCAPTWQQLQDAVTWIEEHRKQGGVFVHCAAGHGRSATIVAAYLLHIQKVIGVQDALDFIRSKRPKISLGEGQLAVLQEYFKDMRYVYPERVN
jgi:protein-tyrosine phosphatase